jgi:hypothetical protein
MKEFEAGIARERSSSTIGRFVLLHRASFQLSPTTTVLGCTLWTRLADDIADFTWAVTDLTSRGIKGMTPALYNSRHEADRAWLEGEINRLAEEAPQSKIVIFTHHAPTRELASDPKFAVGANGVCIRDRVGGRQCVMEIARRWLGIRAYALVLRLYPEWDSRTQQPERV